MPDKDKCFTCATLPVTIILYNIYICFLYDYCQKNCFYENRNLLYNSVSNTDNRMFH